jgi:hypothetical protein
MREKLLSLYTNRHADFKKITATFPEVDLSGPFLMSPNKDYNIQKNPLLIVGQETNGWCYDIDDLNQQMTHYENFNLGINYYSSPFWNVTRKLESALNNNAYSSAWTNISKFDLDGTRSYGEYEEAISGLDNILISEIKIVKPKFCVFFTGPSFDGRIKNIFDEVEFIDVPDWNNRQFCRLKHPNLPEYTFRSYHPKSLRIKRLENNFINYFSSLSN